MLELRPKANAVEAVEITQSRRLQLALALLLVALAAVLVRNRDFWFGSAESSADYEVAPAVTEQAAIVAPSKINAAPVQPKPAKKQITPAAPAQPKSESSGAVASKRTVLPPLDIEVIAGDTRRTLRPGSTAADVIITNSGSAPAIAANSALTVNAGERERLSTGAGAVPQTSIAAPLPLLAQQMKVQGSVVLQALIGLDGEIQDLRVLSGPAILASAARQAVSQWKFKPYLQNGQPVETKARITVNFTIKVADESPRIS